MTALVISWSSNGRIRIRVIVATVLISAQYINSLKSQVTPQSTGELAYDLAHDNFMRCQLINRATCGTHMFCYPPNAPNSLSCTIYRTSLIFDLSTIPVGAVIGAVTLTLKFRWEGFGTIFKDWDVVFKKNNSLSNAQCGSIVDKQAEYMNLLGGTEISRFTASDIIGGWHGEWKEKILTINPSILSGLATFKVGILSSDDLADDCPNAWKGLPNDVYYEQTRLLAVGNGKWDSGYNEWLDDIPELAIIYTTALGNPIVDQLIYQHAERMRV